ncbi:MAG: hypothetical protein ACFE96_14735 [Candidatus Hermodarchaeota archaeon]
MAPGGRGGPRRWASKFFTTAKSEVTQLSCGGIGVRYGRRLASSKKVPLGAAKVYILTKSGDLIG